ncbi:MAG TPA: hypothetical protein VGD26_04515 [Chitinophagaceae bacterium]|jgi:hypothetical protein
MRKLILLLLLIVSPILAFSQRTLENVSADKAILYRGIEAKGDTIDVNFKIHVVKDKDDKVSVSIRNVSNDSVQVYNILTLDLIERNERFAYFLYGAVDQKKEKYSVATLYDKKLRLLKLGLNKNGYMIIFLINYKDEQGL